MYRHLMLLPMPSVRGRELKRSSNHICVRPSNDALCARARIETADAGADTVSGSYDALCARARIETFGRHLFPCHVFGMPSVRGRELKLDQ